MNVLIWVVCGVLVAGIARGLMRERGYGLLNDLILGVLGGVVGGWGFRMLGFSFNGPQDLVRHVFVSLVGAVAVLGLARWVRPVVRETEILLGGTGGVGELEHQIRKLGDMERRLFERLIKREGRLRDPNAEFDQQMTFGQRLADRVARYGGSWTFIGTFLLLMMIWMAINTDTRVRFDPYPFILLNLCLSCLAALQAPIIMMSQNRQAARDRLDVRNDYEVNLRAEVDIQRLHAKLDEQRMNEWKELLEAQQRQIEKLDRIATKLGCEA